MVVLTKFSLRCSIFSAFHYRIYFKIGPRFWWVTTAVAMTVTVLGEESHPGYVLMCVGDAR